MEPMSHYEVASVLVAQAGKRLRQHLELDARNVDNLDEWELALVKRTQGASFVDRTMNRAAQLDKLDREAERINRPEERIERARFEMENYVKVPANNDEGDKSVTRAFTR